MQTGLSQKRHVGAILLGGRSTRFGSPKALAEVGGRTVLERVLTVFETVLPTTILVTAAAPRDEDSPVPVASPFDDVRGVSRPRRPERPAVDVVTDLVPGAGPLGGIHAALLAARARDAAGVCIAACDAPFIEESLLRTLLTFCGEHDAVMPVTGKPERLQPLFAWYSSDIVEQVEANIRRGRLALHHLIDDLPKVKLLPAEEIPLRRPAELVFLNVNTPSDLVAARNAIEEYPDEG